MTVNQIIEDICGVVSYNTSDSTQNARALRWANDAQLDMAKLNWPELVTRNATLTTTGVESNDLTASNPTLFRIIDKSVRCGSRNLVHRPKSWFDEVDPDRVMGSPAYFYDMCSVKDFRLFPAQASGSTVYYDWLAYPATLAAGGAETAISFNKERHWLIAAGGAWRAKKYVGDTDWLTDKFQWKRDLKEEFLTSSAVKHHAGIITPIDF